MRILDSDTVVSEIAFSGDLVRAIEDLLPVKQCHTEEDFQKLFRLYGSDGWNCDDTSWKQLVDKYCGNVKMHPDSRAIIL